ncbi:hypothetical protein GT037_005809 [Alternaria burnsii]|uniref:Uncharacterized protein n=1 Tax=Alternaria burnsii TaxID=1187904 RepID=A0A8H7B6M9_9PLEO|nr:uncharacterized protein GT037_005809 [Alternaria burnsii]KAF7676304.1 hypothetical protein GT037_005809 [Alternaria burnsii]
MHARLLPNGAVKVINIAVYDETFVLDSIPRFPIGNPIRGILCSAPIGTRI